MNNDDLIEIDPYFDFIHGLIEENFPGFEIIISGEVSDNYLMSDAQAQLCIEIDELGPALAVPDDPSTQVFLRGRLVEVLSYLQACRLRGQVLCKTYVHPLELITLSLKTLFDEGVPPRSVRRH